MKRTFLFLIFSGLSFYAAAQGFSLGLKAGVNMSNLDGFEDSKNYTSFNAGVFGLIKLSKIGIQPEVLYSVQGTKVDDFKTELSYVNIPVMVKLYLAGGFNLQAGPQFGFLTSAKTDGEDIKDLVKSSDMAACVGLGWDAPFGLLFDARYNIGLNDINNSEDVEGAIKNKVIQISIGYKLFKFGN